MNADAWTPRPVPKYAVLAWEHDQETAQLAREAADAARRAAELSAEVDRLIALHPVEEPEPDVPFLLGHDDRNWWDQQGDR